MTSIILTWLCIAAGFFLVLRWMETRMLYYPNNQNYGRPADYGLKHEDVWLTTADGVRIHAWFLPATQAAGDSVSGTPRLACLFLHGNAGNITARLEKLLILQDIGLDVLIVSYRGYGQSAGRPSEKGTYRDADAAYEWLVKEKGIAPEQIILFGESLGCGPAVDLASREKVGGVILESSFTSVPDMASKLFPFLPLRWVVKNKYDNLSKIRRVTAPLLVMHSPQDEIIPFEHGQRNFAAANEPKEFFEMIGDHNSGFIYTGAAYGRQIKAFADKISAAVAARKESTP